MPRTRTKVCGFTRAVDIAAAADAGVDAFGFNLARGPRCRPAAALAPLVAQVPAFAVAVGLFCDADEASIEQAMQVTRCQAVQLHGDEPPELAAELRQRWPVIKAFRVRDAATLDAAAAYPCDAVLLDAWVPGVAGGSGASWDHRLMLGRAFGKPVILAGGLTPETVGEAVRLLRPSAVDTASGVEAGVPGEKDAARMAAFVAAVQTADHTTID